MADLIEFTQPNTWWSQMQTGDLIGAIINSYTWSMGGFFYIMIAFMGMMMIYFKTQDFGTTVITGMIISAGFVPFLAAFGIGGAMSAIYGFIVLGITFILYKVFK